MTLLTATADICDAYPDLASVTELPFRDFGAMTSFSGQVETVRCFEDNSMVRRALEGPGEGRILVVDGGASLRVALLGDKLAAQAVTNGWIAVVVEGCVRDTAALRELPLGVKALASCPMRSYKRGEGQVGVVLRIGRMDVRSGWWLYADADGILTMPGEALRPQPDR